MSEDEARIRRCGMGAMLWIVCVCSGRRFCGQTGAVSWWGAKAGFVKHYRGVVHRGTSVCGGLGQLPCPLAVEEIVTGRMAVWMFIYY